MLHWLKSLFTKRVRTFSGRDYQLFMDYQQAGGRFGYAVSYLYLGECEGFEEPIYHAKMYRERFLHKVEPVVDFQRLSQGEMQIAQYRLPSTKNAKPQD
jgi:hypothetical protein